MEKNGQSWTPDYDGIIMGYGNFISIKRSDNNLERKDTGVYWGADPDMGDHVDTMGIDCDVMFCYAV